ncbi:hypothetical protein AERO9A_190300 [Aeromonas salmonicida]|nr:hypothetical protein AERO9A_190300 [Aeromonas salmonicida]
MHAISLNLYNKTKNNRIFINSKRATKLVHEFHRYWSEGPP